MLRYAVSCLLLLLLAVRVNGAEPDSGNDTAEEPAESPPAPEDIDAALAEEIRAAEEAAASETTADADDTFVPSVQISEDLSVSFPVDI